MSHKIPEVPPTLSKSARSFWTETKRKRCHLRLLHEVEYLVIEKVTTSFGVKGMANHDGLKPLTDSKWSLVCKQRAMWARLEYLDVRFQKRLQSLTTAL